MTISDSERLKIKNEKLEMEKKESENQSTKMKDLELKLEMVIHKMDVMQNTSETNSDIAKN